MTVVAHAVRHLSDAFYQTDSGAFGQTDRNNVVMDAITDMAVPL